MTKWTSECDRKLHRLVGYIQQSKSHRLIGWVGDELCCIQPHLYADADFAGCVETQRSTSGVHAILRGPNTSFPTAGASKRQGCVSHSTPEAEIVATHFAMSTTGLPGQMIWDLRPGATRRCGTYSAPTGAQWGGSTRPSWLKRNASYTRNPRACAPISILRHLPTR